MNKTIAREIEVALSKHSQPVWFRVVKYILIVAALYFLWNNPWLWIIFSVLFVFSLALHLWYRYKTKGWTQSYGMWKYFKSKYDS